MSDNIFEALRESHERQRELCDALLATPPEKDVRRAAYHALQIEERAHAAAEERYLYAKILMEDIGLDPSRHALTEHHRIDEIFAELNDRDCTEQGWLQRADTLCHEIKHHLKEEESRFFQLAGKALDEAQKVNLAGEYRSNFAHMKKTYTKKLGA